MPWTVAGAFDQFRANNVDLSPSVTQQGRASRDYLYERLKSLSYADPSFPKILGDFVPYGSFARRTKTEILDDIDLLVLINGGGTTDTAPSQSPLTSWLQINNPVAALSPFPDQWRYVNSTKVLNAVRDSLGSLAIYGKAEMHRNGQAVTVSLASYDWSFDIVPAVPVGVGGNPPWLHYLIPNGYGDWMRTDPRIDQTNVTACNQRHQGLTLPIIRLLKYWSRHRLKAQLASYYFETLVINCLRIAPPLTSIRGGLDYFFRNGSANLYASCPDPKGLGDALDADVSFLTKLSIGARLSEAATWSGYALMYEGLGDQEKAIYWWQQVFGEVFPSYG